MALPWLGMGTAVALPWHFTLKKESNDFPAAQTGKKDCFALP